MDIDTLRGKIISAVKGKNRMFTAKKLATESKVSTSHISNFINRNRIPGKETLKSIEKAYLKLCSKEGYEPGAEDEYLNFLDNLVKDVNTRFFLKGIESAPKRIAIIKDIFVDVEFIQVLPRQTQERPTLNDVEQNTQNRVIYIIGEAGSGKSTLIKYRILQLIQEYRGDKEKPLPILFPLNAFNRSWDESSASGLLQCVIDWYSKGSLNVEGLFTTALNQGKAYVLLDGFDEIANAKHDSAEKQISLFIDAYRNRGVNRFIITQRGTLRPLYESGAYPFEPDVALYIDTFERKEKIRKLIDKWSKYLFSENSQKIKQPTWNFKKEYFIETISKESHRKIAKNPFYLTLLTVLFCHGYETGQSLHLRTQRIALLEDFINRILGSWRNVRSIDGFPPPELGDMTGFIKPALIRLGGAFIDAKNGELKIELKKDDVQYYFGKEFTERELFKFPVSAPSQTGSSGMAAGAVAYAINAGILVSNDKKTFISFGPHWELVRDLFVGLWLAQQDEEKMLNEYFIPCMKEPLKYKLIKPLANMIVIGGARDWAPEKIWKYLWTAAEWRPYKGVIEDELSERFFNIIPLSIMFYQYLLDEDIISIGRGFIDYIVGEIRLFYEKTDYAVITSGLRRYIEEFQQNKLGNLDEERPSDLQRLLIWLKKIEAMNHDNKRTQLDIIWRYQSKVEAFTVLIDMVQKYYPLEDASLAQSRQFLLRRILFGIRFVSDNEEVLKAIEFLHNFQSSAEVEVVKNMVQHSLKKLNHRREQESYVPQNNDHAEVSPQSLNLDNLLSIPCLDVIKNANKFVEETWKHDGTRRGEIIHQLTEVLSQNQVPRIKANACILIGKILNRCRIEEPRRMEPPNGDLWKCVEVLLNAADPKKGQYENIDAAQVYDLAAWALRTIYDLPTMSPVILPGKYASNGELEGELVSKDAINDLPIF